MPKGRSEAHGYPATLLSDFCYAILSARRAGRLQRQQEHIALVAETLMMGFAQVGIVALVDEATGYQYDRAREALAKILEDFVAEEAAKWAKTFPDEYFIEHARLRGLSFRHDRKAPLAGKVVYDRLAPGVLEELRNRNADRKKKHHQYLLSRTWRQFKDQLDIVLPRHNQTLSLFGLDTLPGTLEAPDLDEDE